MVRNSDKPMSGTAYGKVVLHTAPDAALSRPLAIIHDGDIIELNVHERRLDIDITEEELTARLHAWRSSVSVPASDCEFLFHSRVLGADTGADFDFLVGCRGSAVGKDSN